MNKFELTDDHLILSDDCFRLVWDLTSDHAQLTCSGDNDPIWSGPLLPSVEVDRAGTRDWVKAEYRSHREDEDQIGLELDWGSLGTGSLILKTDAHGLQFRDLTLNWSASPLPIVSLYFGKLALDDEQRRMVERPEARHWASWHASGFCVPSAKGAPIQSFFRRFDFGESHIALGSFGSTMGTPYAAAYPRPVYAMAMGDDRGFLSFGAGEIPDAAMTLDLEAISGCLHFLYREDLWGGPEGSRRIWKAPLQLAWGETAWDAYHELFAMTPVSPKPFHHMKSQWNSWGEFISGHFDLEPAARKAAELMKVELFTVDMFWETSCSDAIPNEEHFPHLDADIAAIKAMGLAVGFWQAIAWIADPGKYGLNDEDLLCGPDGRPKLATWHSDPRAKTHHFGYFLDPASEKARAFLRERTHRVMNSWNPALLKLDFGYAIPSPNSAASRDPAMRGERTSMELVRVIRDAAREINPEVTIQLYGISPLLHEFQDMAALDDQADAGAWEEEGHRSWSVWSALAGSHGMPVMASSGYDWSVEDENLLNTAVIGAPGGLVPLNATATVVDFELKAVRRSWVNRSFRKNPKWKPLWLNTEKGKIGLEAEARCFGRLEQLEDNWELTALALRETGDLDAVRQELDMNWVGRWILLSRDDRPVFSSGDLLVLPLNAGSITFPSGVTACEVQAHDVDGNVTRVKPDTASSEGRLTLKADPSALIAYTVRFN